MRITPPQRGTLEVSAVLALLAVIAICTGYFVGAAITGTLAAINLLVGCLKKGY